MPIIEPTYGSMTTAQKDAYNSALSLSTETPTEFAPRPSIYDVNPALQRPVTTLSGGSGVSTIKDIQGKLDTKMESYAKPPEPVQPPPPAETTPESMLTEKTDQQRANEAQKVEITGFYDTQVSDFKNFANQMMQTSDSATQGVIQGLTSQFEQRRTELLDLNRRQQALVTTSQMRSGGSKYTPEISQGVIGTEEAAGISRLNSLEQSYRQAVAEAQAAGQQKKFELMYKTWEKVNELDTKRREELKELQKTVDERNAKIREKLNEAIRDSAIADLFAHGVTDVYEALDYLNFDDKGNQVGDFTAKEVAEAYGRLNPDRTSIQGIATKLSSFDAPDEVVQSVLNARSFKEAYSMATPYMKDPKAKFELENLNLENQLKQLQMAKLQKEVLLLGEPTAKEKAEEKKALKSTESTNLILQDKIDLIDSLLTAKGLSSRVGTNLASRAATGLGGNIIKATSLVGIPGLGQDLVRGISGQGQAFAGGVHKLASKEFVDALIDARARGATFGSLTEREGDALRASATQLNDWEIKDKSGKGMGVWNIDEASFKRELNNIKMMAQRAISRSTGSDFTDEETRILDDIFQSQEATLDPSLYYTKQN